MSETTPRRLSYVARILLVPLGKSGDDLVEQMARAGLTDVDVVTAHSPAEAAVRDINAEATVVRRIDELVTESDMVILIGSVLPQVPIGFATAMAEAARESGNLLAGVLIDQQDWDSHKGPKRWQYCGWNSTCWCPSPRSLSPPPSSTFSKGDTAPRCLRASSLDLRI